MDEQWKMVPVEPTDGMVQAAHHIDLSYMPGQEGADRAAIYRAMLAAAPQPPSASGEREAFEAWSIRTNQGYDLARNVSGKMQTYENDLTEHAYRGYFHASIAAPSPGIDAAEQKPVADVGLKFNWNDHLLENDALDYQHDFRLFQVVESYVCKHLAAPSPAASALDPHPPTRHCMCADCKPSFAPDAHWWEQEAERLLDEYVNSVVQGGATYADDIRRAALLAHLKVRP